ncbi:MAG: carboxypeptidase-like regulatory domain-containing protein [Gammaproteobacteria bacterium]
MKISSIVFCFLTLLSWCCASQTQAASIQGIVVDEADSAPLAGLFVRLYRWRSSGWWEGVADIPSDAQGAFKFTGLPAGRYLVSSDGMNDQYVWTRYLGEFYDNVPLYDIEHATNIDLAVTDHYQLTAPMALATRPVYVENLVLTQQTTASQGTQITLSADVVNTRSKTVEAKFWLTNGTVREDPTRYFGLVSDYQAGSVKDVSLVPGVNKVRKTFALPKNYPSTFGFVVMHIGTSFVQPLAPEMGTYYDIGGASAPAPARQAIPLRLTADGQVTAWKYAGP